MIVFGAQHFMYAAFIATLIPAWIPFHLFWVYFTGAGFIVALAGDIMTMPGLPEHPAAENIDVDEQGRITGLF